MSYSKSIQKFINKLFVLVTTVLFAFTLFSGVSTHAATYGVNNCSKVWEAENYRNMKYGGVHFDLYNNCTWVYKNKPQIRQLINVYYNQAMTSVSNGLRPDSAWNNLYWNYWSLFNVLYPDSY